ncbi:hypothetical protein FHG87_019027 [Trinorchestia longiramus]|nr:hypothetical protein FHG87_019027 [Trinorchestia longiramus]
MNYCLNCNEQHRILAATCPYRKLVIHQINENRKKHETEKNNRTYLDIAKTSIKHTNQPTPAVTLSSNTHVKLTALVIKVHIASLAKTESYGSILSESLKRNFDIDTSFPDRDFQKIFNLFINSTPISNLPPLLPLKLTLEQFPCTMGTQFWSSIKRMSTNNTKHNTPYITLNGTYYHSSRGKERLFTTHWSNIYSGVDDPYNKFDENHTHDIKTQMTDSTPCLTPHEIGDITSLNTSQFPVITLQELQ